MAQFKDNVKINYLGWDNAWICRSSGSGDTSLTLLQSWFNGSDILVTSD